MKTKNTKIIIISALIISLLAIGIGFAAFSTILSVEGTASISSGTWNVYFSDIERDDANSTSGIGTTLPEIGDNENAGSNTIDTKIDSFDVTFSQPNQKVVYIATVTNGGTYNAKLTVKNVGTPSCSGTGDDADTDATNVCNNLTYTVTGPEVDSTLSAGSSATYTITIQYNDISDASLLPKASVSITIPDSTFTYTQDSSSSGEGDSSTETVNIATYITNLYSNATKTEVTNNSITYNYTTSESLMNDRLGGTTASLDGGNIRYYGASPNNYIDIGDTYKEDVTTGNWVSVFGDQETATEMGITDTASCLTFVETAGITTDEDMQSMAGMTINEFCSATEIHAGDPKPWRIIGVFDGKVKVIRDESIGEYSWDTSAEDVNSGWGMNEWSQADLMKLLNPGYNSVTVGGSLWWNSASGNCYNDSKNGYSSCDFTSTGLNDSVKSLIASDTWYLGGWNGSEIYANQIYGYERGTNVITNPSDGITRMTTWTGKVGLMYPSDYGYAVDFNSCTKTLYSYDDSTCASSDWLINGVQWMITPSSSNAGCAWGARGGGYVNYDYYVGNAIGVRPVFSLVSSATMEAGHTGSSSDPYVLSLS